MLTKRSVNPHSIAPWLSGCRFTPLSSFFAIKHFFLKLAGNGDARGEETQALGEDAPASPTCNTSPLHCSPFFRWHRRMWKFRILKFQMWKSLITTSKILPFRVHSSEKIKFRLKKWVKAKSCPHRETIQIAASQPKALMHWVNHYDSILGKVSEALLTKETRAESTQWKAQRFLLL